MKPLWTVRKWSAPSSAPTPVATRPGEILAGAEFYTYDDKYKNGVSQTVIPAHLPEAKLDEVKTYAAMAYTALNCEGLARCDFFVEHGTGRVLINEINTFPGFTSISMYPKLMEHEGLRCRPHRPADRTGSGKNGKAAWIIAPSACSTAAWAG